MIRKITMAGSLLLLASCIHPIRNQNAMMGTWMGGTRTELIQKWGIPTSTFQDGANEVFVYGARTTTNTTTSPTTTVNVGTKNKPRWVTIGGDTETNSHTGSYRMFWINPSGRIVNWAWKGF